MRTGTISFEEFMNLPPCRVQRPTYRSAIRLLRSLKLNGNRGRLDEIAIANWPDGRQSLIDGHSRRELFAQGLWPPPPQFSAIYYDVHSKAEEASIYESFNHASSAKDGRDQLESFCKDLEWEPTSAAFKNGRSRNTIKVSAALYKEQLSLRNMTLAEATLLLLPALRVIDETCAGHPSPTAFILAGGLVSYKISPKALSFFEKIILDQRDDSYSPNQHIVKHAQKNGTGGRYLTDSTGKYLWAWDAFMRGEMPQRLRSVSDLPGFIRGLKKSYSS